jgi:hypothetical protein
VPVAEATVAMIGEWMSGLWPATGLVQPGAAAAEVAHVAA